MNNPQGPDKTVYVFDEIDDVAEILKGRGFRVEYVSPYQQPNQPQSVTFRAVIFDPYSLTKWPGIKHNNIMTRILRQARQDRAKRIVLSSLKKTEALEQGYMEGRDYDVYLEKPISNIERILEHL